MATLSGSRVREAGGGAAEVEAETEPDAEVIDDGKAPGIPATCGASGVADSVSGTTPPSRLPEPAKPLRGV